MCLKGGKINAINHITKSRQKTIKSLKYIQKSAC